MGNDRKRKIKGHLVFYRKGHKSHMSGFKRFIKCKNYRRAFEFIVERQIQKLNQELTE